MERHERAFDRQRRSVKTILEVCREKLKLHEQWMRVVRNTPEERSSHTNIMERRNHRQTLVCKSTVELPSKFNKMLNITVDEEHERREKDGDRIDRYNQIYKFSNLPGPELELKVAYAGYSSLYNYESFSAQDRAWNIVHPSNKVCQAIFVRFQSIREGYPARNMAGHSKNASMTLSQTLEGPLLWEGPWTIKVAHTD